MLFDPPVDFRRDRANDHATATFEDALMGSGGQSLLRISPQFDHGKLQRLRGGLDGLLVLGPEPGGLGQRGAAGRALRLAEEGAGALTPSAADNRQYSCTRKTSFSERRP